MALPPEKILTDEILILGNPNSGKTLLFNRLTGLKAKVANFPGVTVEIRKAQADGLTLYDYPGIYSLKALTLDEKVAIDRMLAACAQGETRALVCVLDATRLERSLYLFLQMRTFCLELGLPLVGAVNVIDEVLGAGRNIDIEGLKKELGVPVFALSAKFGSGLKDLKGILAKFSTPAPSASQMLNEKKTTSWTMEQLREKVARITEGSANILKYKTESARLAREYAPSADTFLRLSNKLDAFFLSTWGGPPAFALIMLFLFQAIFSWSSPLMDFIDLGLTQFAGIISPLITIDILRDFFNEALVAGLGSFLVFAPQIFVLFCIIGVLEDSGYLARAAIILHRPLSWAGLSGRSFVPLLSGHACAIPAMLSTRMIESPRKRLLTLLVVPFTSCSARLPVYALLIGGFVPATTLLGGLIDLRGLAFFGLFALGVVTAILAAAILDKILKSKAKNLDDAPFIVELPPYRWPSFSSILQNAGIKTWGFIYNAGFIIFLVTVVVWTLGYFPGGSGDLENSWLGSLGKFLEPVVAPLGMDWKIGVAILASFLAREVFVGTLGTLYGIESAGDNLNSLSERLSGSGMTLATAVALLVFYALAMQCVSTLAVMRKETGSFKIPVMSFFGMTLLAYGAAALAYWLMS